MTNETNRLLQSLMSESVFRDALHALPKLERFKRFPPFSGVRHALKKVLSCHPMLCDICQTEQIDPAAVEAVLFREVLGFGWEDLLDGFRKSASRGLCQIRPGTAAKADRDLGLPVRAPREYRKLLMQRNGNLTYCARILKAEFEKSDPGFSPQEKWFHAFRIYNGSKRYARQVLMYQEAFHRILHTDSPIPLRKHR